MMGGHWLRILAGSDGTLPAYCKASLNRISSPIYASTTLGCRLDYTHKLPLP